MDATLLSQIAQWADGELVGTDADITNICTDSRKLAKGDLFLALRGENFDGHAFVDQAYEKGAAAVFIDHEAPAPSRAFIRVTNTLQALQKIAAAYRATLPLQVVAITGSNGKTSTKDFTAAVLSAKHRVIKTDGNFNNHIGLPLTLLRASAEHTAGVFEIGMNHPGEIAPLAAMARPRIAIITNVGVAHIEFMGTRDAIAQEKGALAEAIRADGYVVLNAEDDYTDSIAARTRGGIITAGIGRGDLKAGNLRNDADGTSFTIHAGHETAEARLNVAGSHMIQNALLAVAAGRLLDVPLADCAAALEKVTLTKGRLGSRTIRGIRFLDDTYNANPDSVRAALRTLGAMPCAGRRIAVLGKMGELGSQSGAGHRQVGEDAVSERICIIIAVDAPGIPATHQVADNTEATSLLRDLARPGDIVLVKGSRSARMEHIIEEFAS